MWLWLLTAGGFLLLLLMGVGLWYQLPRWEPDWVLERSPFVEPFVRATAQIHPAPTGTPQSEQGYTLFATEAIYQNEAFRLESWGDSAIPGLERCLRDNDPAIRIHGFRLLRFFDRPLRTQMPRLLADPDPWMRLFAWWHLAKFSGAPDAPVEDRIAAIDTAMAQLTDQDEYIRDRSRDYLAANAEQVWDRRGELNGHLLSGRGPAFLATVIGSLCRHSWEVGNEAPLSKDLYFPLLSLSQWPDVNGDQERILHKWIHHFHVDYADLYMKLSAMQRGERPWEPGAQPWMHEQLHRLLSRRITATLVAVDVKEAVERLFPQGNVLIHPNFGMPKTPVSMVINNQPMIEVLLALSHQIEGELHLDNGVAALLPPIRFDFLPRSRFDGFMPSPMIGLAWQVDTQNSTISEWQVRLKQKVSIRCKSTELAREFAERGRQIGLPIDFQVIEQGTWPDEVEFHDLPLEQILRFWAGVCNVRLELDTSGLRAHPP